MKLAVDIDKLNEAATSLENAHRSYASELKNVISAIESIREFWQGKDGEMLVKRALALERNLNKLERLIDMYADFLRDAASEYDSVDAEVYRLICNV